MIKLRSLLSQLWAIFPYSCIQFILGALSGFHVIVIAELHKPDSEITTSLDQISWFSSLDIFKLVGTAFTGLLMHHFGCRLVALFTALLFFGSFLSFYYSTTATSIIVTRAFSSLLAVNPLVGPYISEISEPLYRSWFLAMAQLSCSVGVFFSLLLGSLMDWRTVALVNLAFPVLAVLTVLATPNSPTWFASKGRLDEAEYALCQLRGWVDQKRVRSEFRALVEESTSEMKLEGESTQLLQWFRQRSFYLPFGTFSLMLIMSILSGSSTMDDYATVIFRQLNSPIEESVATAIMGAMGILGHLLLLLVIHRTGKRMLTFVSVAVIGLCQAMVAIIGFSELQDEYSWVSTIAVIVASLANASGIGTIVLMLIGEIFPSSVRYVAASMSFAVKMIGSSLMNKLYLYMVDAFTASGVFLFFASMSFAGLVTYWFCFPETEGKTLQEIEDQFKGHRQRYTCDNWKILTKMNAIARCIWSHIA